MDEEREREYDPFSQVRVILSDALSSAAFSPDFEKRYGGCDDKPVSDDGVRADGDIGPYAKGSSKP